MMNHKRARAELERLLNVLDLHGDKSFYKAMSQIAQSTTTGFLSLEKLVDKNALLKEWNEHYKAENAKLKDQLIALQTDD